LGGGGEAIAEKAPDESTERLAEDISKHEEMNFMTESYSISDLFSPS
jgi:hypothetical protein